MTYAEEEIPVVRVIQVQVEYRDYMGMHTLYVLLGEGPILLGEIGSSTFGWIGSIWGLHMYTRCHSPCLQYCRRMQKFSRKSWGICTSLQPSL